jgi:ATP-dependent DNA ligase
MMALGSLNSTDFMCSEDSKSTLKTLNVPLSVLIRAVRKHQLDGIVAKRTGSPYRSGERSADWVKWRANRGQEFVIGGYIRNGDVLD